MTTLSTFVEFINDRFSTSATDGDVIFFDKNGIILFGFSTEGGITMDQIMSEYIVYTDKTVDLENMLVKVTGKFTTKRPVFRVFMPTDVFTKYYEVKYVSGKNKPVRTVYSGYDIRKAVHAFEYFTDFVFDPDRTLYEVKNHRLFTIAGEDKNGNRTAVTILKQI
jgi:hypothetical protein